MQPKKAKFEKNILNVAKVGIPEGSKFFKPRPDCIDFYVEKPVEANGGMREIPPGSTEIEMQYKINPKTGRVDGYGEPTFR